MTRLNEELERRELLSSRTYVDSTPIEANVRLANLESTDLSPAEFAQRATAEDDVFVVRETIPKNADGRVVEDGVLQRQLTKPPPGQVFRDALAHLALGGDLVDDHEDESADQDLRMDRRAADPRIVLGLEELDQRREVEVRVDAPEQMLGINEITQGLGGTGVERAVAPAAVDGLEHEGTSSEQANDVTRFYLSSRAFFNRSV